MQARVRKELAEAGLMATPEQGSPRPLQFAGLPHCVTLPSCIIVNPLIAVHYHGPSIRCKTYRVTVTIRLIRLPLQDGMSVCKNCLWRFSTKLIVPNLLVFS